MLNIEAIETLKLVYKKLPDKDQGFALSLIGQFKTRNKLSAKQWPWVEKLIEAANGTPANDPTKTGFLGDFSKVFEMFSTAKKHLKYPEMMLRLDEDRTMKLWVQGPKSKAPGSLAVTFNKDWVGRVTPEGDWKPGTHFDDLTVSSVIALLASFADDPADLAAAHGKILGRCCFCRLRLTSEVSTSVGYGEICAKRWGLTWKK